MHKKRTRRLVYIILSILLLSCLEPVQLIQASGTGGYRYQGIYQNRNRRYLFQISNGEFLNSYEHWRTVQLPNQGPNDRDQFIRYAFLIDAGGKIYEPGIQTTYSSEDYRTQKTLRDAERAEEVKLIVFYGWVLSEKTFEDQIITQAALWQSDHVGYTNVWREFNPQVNQLLNKVRQHHAQPRFTGTNYDRVNNIIHVRQGETARIDARNVDVSHSSYVSGRLPEGIEVESKDGQLIFTAADDARLEYYAQPMVFERFGKINGEVDPGQFLVSRGESAKLYMADTFNIEDGDQKFNVNIKVHAKDEELPEMPLYYNKVINLIDPDGKPADGLFEIHDEQGVLSFLEEEGGYRLVPDNTPDAITILQSSGGKLFLKGLDPEVNYRILQVTEGEDDLVDRDEKGDFSKPEDDVEDEETTIEIEEPTPPSEPDVEESYDTEVKLVDKDGQPLDGSYELHDEKGPVWFVEKDDGYHLVPEGTEGATTTLQPKDGKIDLHGLDPEKNYILKQTEAADGQPELKDDIEISKPEDGAGGIVVEVPDEVVEPNDPEPGVEESYDTEVKLVDKDGQPLDGSYELHDENGPVWFLEMDDGYHLVPEGTEGATTTLQPKDGKIDLHGLDPEKNYTLKQTEAADGQPELKDDVEISKPEDGAGGIVVEVPDEVIEPDEPTPDDPNTDQPNPDEPNPDEPHPDVEETYDTEIKLVDKDGQPLDGSYELHDENGPVWFLEMDDGYHLVPEGTDGATTVLRPRDGKINLHGLDPEKNYTLQQTEAADGQPELKEDIDLSKPEDGAGNIVVEVPDEVPEPDEPEPGVEERYDTEVKLVDKDGQPLDGSYELHDENGPVWFLEMDDGYHLVPEGTEGATTTLQPKDGKIDLHGLDPEKNYTLKQTEAADGQPELKEDIEISKPEDGVGGIVVEVPDEVPEPDEPTPDDSDTDQPEPNDPNPDQPNPDEPDPDEPGPGKPDPDEPHPDVGETYDTEIRLVDEDGQPIDGSYEIHDDHGPIWVIEEEDGYHVVPEGTEGATTVITPTDGKIDIHGLDPEKDYQLIQTEAGENQPTIQEPIPIGQTEEGYSNKVTVKPDGSTTVTQEATQPQDSEHPDHFDIDVKLKDENGQPLDGVYEVHDENGPVYFIEQEDGYHRASPDSEGATTKLIPRDGELKLHGLDPEKNYQLHQVETGTDSIRIERPIELKPGANGGNESIEVIVDSQADDAAIFDVQVEVQNTQGQIIQGGAFQVHNNGVVVAFFESETPGVYQLSPTGSEPVQQLKVRNGRLRIEGLELSQNYVLEEVLPPSEYQALGETIALSQAQVEENARELKLTLRYEALPGGLYLTHFLEDSQQKIQEATYQILDASGNPLTLSGENGLYTVQSDGQTTFSSSNGEARVRGLEIGHYVLKLIDMDSSYQPSVIEQAFEIRPNELTEIRLTSARQFTTLRLQKVDEGTGVPIAMRGFGFRLSRDAAGLDLIRNVEGEVDFFTDENGELHFPALPPGTYYLEECFTPEPYLRNSEMVEIVLDGSQGAVYEIQFTNQLQKGQISLVKQGPRLQGFHKETVVTNSSSAKKPLLLDVARERQAEVYAEDSETNLNESLNREDTFASDAAEGTYRLLNAQGDILEEGLSFAAGPIERLLPSGTYVLESMNSEDPTRYSFQHTAGQDETEILWTPLFELGPVEGVVYAIHAAETIYNLPFESPDREVLYNEGDLVQQLMTDGNGVASSKPLPLGRYRIHEITTREGFKPMESPIEVELSSLGEAINLQIVDEALEQGRQSYTVCFEKQYEASSQWKKLEDLQQQTRFGLFNELPLTVDGHTLPAGSLLGLASPVKDAEGRSMVSFDAPFATSYYIRELHTHEVYRPSNDQRVTLHWDPQGSNRVTELPAVENKLQRMSITVRKLDELTGEALSGVKFALYRRSIDPQKDDQFIGEWTTGSEGSVTIEALERGEYYIKSVAPLPGYLKSKDLWEVHLAVDRKNYEITLYDKPTQTAIEKLDKLTNSALKGAHLRLTTDDGSVIESWISDGKPHTLYGLIPGETYHLYEDLAPLGYATAKELIFKVNEDGELQTIELYNRETITDISAVDATNLKHPTQAKLKLIASKDGKVVRAWTADEGVERFYGLVVGEDYEIHEVETPEGYHPLRPMRFTVQDDNGIRRIIVKHTPLSVKPDEVEEDPTNPSQKDPSNPFKPGNPSEPNGTNPLVPQESNASPQGGTAQTGENQAPYYILVASLLGLAALLFILRRRLLSRDTPRQGT